MDRYLGQLENRAASLADRDRREVELDLTTG